MDWGVIFFQNAMRCLFSIARGERWEAKQHQKQFALRNPQQGSHHVIPTIQVEWPQDSNLKAREESLVSTIVGLEWNTEITLPVREQALEKIGGIKVNQKNFEKEDKTIKKALYQAWQRSQRNGESSWNQVPGLRNVEGERLEEEQKKHKNIWIHVFPVNRYWHPWKRSWCYVLLHLSPQS